MHFYSYYTNRVKNPDKSNIKPIGYETLLGGYTPLLYDAQCDEPVAWGFLITRHLTDEQFGELHNFGKIECINRFTKQWGLITKTLTREDAIKLYGKITDEQFGPRGGWRSVTFGGKTFISKIMAPKYRNNPITPNRLFMVLYRAIWPTEDAGSAGEAQMARDLAIKYLKDVTPPDLPQLQDVLFRVWEGPAKQRGSLDKFKEIYAIAAKTNRNLPGTLAEFSRLKTPGATPPKSQAIPPKASAPPPKPTGKPATKESISPKQPESRATCKACDGRGYTTKTNKENVLKEGKRITCSRCGGTGFEPPPSTGKKGGFWRGSRQQQTEEEEDINRATDNFLKKHGFDKWGRP